MVRDLINTNRIIGGIVGDIAGSVYEFDNYRVKDFTLFGDYHGHKCFATDDTIMTLAVCKAFIESTPTFENLDKNLVRYMQEVGRPYPDCGYGGRFMQWMYSEHPHPYNSFGNGAAMRVSAAAYAANTLSEAMDLAEITASVTHNHPEGIKGAKATAALIYMGLHGFTFYQMSSFADHFYDLNFSIDDIRKTYQFNETCQDTVPQAIVAFLESTDYEDAIRNAISVGGDSDTLACITGSIAGAYYGVPFEIQDKALSYLDPHLRGIYDDFVKTF